LKKIAVVLAGSGVKDGSEIHESVVTLLTIKRNNADYVCFAPDKNQYHVINHTDNSVMKNNERNMLTEAARIARGEIKDLKKYKPDDFDAVIFPGGLGVAKNLFTYAVDGVKCDIDPVVEKTILDTIEAGKPIGAICISPLLVARALRDSNIKPRVTVGNEEDLMAAVKNMNGIPEERLVGEICYDEVNKIVSTPAYTIGKNIAEVATGIEKLVQKIIRIS
jgi:enhancing lycopene biosynthesis protein 2